MLRKCSVFANLPSEAANTWRRILHVLNVVGSNDKDSMHVVHLQFCIANSEQADVLPACASSRSTTFPGHEEFVEHATRWN